MKIHLDLRKQLKPAVSLFIVGLFFHISLAQKSFELIPSNDKFVGVRFPKSGLVCETAPEDCFKITVQGSTITMAGKWVEYDRYFEFRPVWPFTPGITYQVYHQNAVLGTFTIPGSASHEHFTLQVFPSADTLPMNLLKMYFRFSEPMKQIRSDKFVYMLNEGGDTLDNIFLDLQPELWNARGDQLTLWIDPGRVKRDLLRNQKLGPPFERGRSYMLIVSSDWKSQSGSTMATVFRKTFYVGKEDRIKPNPKDWEVSCPGVETRMPLIVAFHEPLDYALLQEAFTIRDNLDKLIDMEVTVEKHESKILLIPAKNWKSGFYRLIIKADLEDLAGNNLNRLFDVDLKEDTVISERKKEWILEFHVK